MQKWYGYQVLAVDGSDIILPDFRKLVQIFDESGKIAILRQPMRLSCGIRQTILSFMPVSLGTVWHMSGKWH